MAGPRRLLGRDFVLLWQGQLVSQLGNQAFLVATMSWTLEATQSPAFMGLLLMASTLPAVLVGPVAGALADRHSRRGLIVVSDLVRGIGQLALAAVMMTAPHATRLTLVLLLCLGFLSGVLGALLTPAFAAAIPDLVAARRLPAANSLHHLSNHAATLTGQAAGGLAYAWVGAAGLVLFDGISFLVSAGCAALARVPSPRPTPSLSVRRHAVAYLHDVREGVVWLWRRPLLRPVVLTFAAVNFLFTPVFVLLPVYVKDVLQRGPEWYGFLLAAAGAGALVGSSVAPVWFDGPSGLRLALLGVGASTVGLGASRSGPLALGMLLGLGLLSALLSVRVTTTLQSSTPRDLRGRVLAVTVALAGAAVPAGLALGGLVGSFARASLSWAIAASGGAILCVAAAFGPRLGGNRASASRPAE